MKSQDYTTSFTVENTPDEAFRAIKNIRNWWSEEIEGPTENVGDEFLYRYKDVHRCRMKMVSSLPGRKIAWRVLDNHFSFTKDQTEWIGTEIDFDIIRRGDKTEVRFTHAGLARDHECFEVCSNAWSRYVNGSLRSLISTGRGNPNRKE